MTTEEGGFIKYQHVERFGTTETEGITHGMCYVFPKIDGTNSQLWWDGTLRAGSRNRELTLDSDNQGFMAWVVNNPNLYAMFLEYPNLRVFGEWLVPHTLKTYQPDAWRRFYVFDVCVDGDYMEYEDYQYILDRFKIDYIIPICKIENPTYERLVAQLDKNTFLIEDGKGTGEGIVIKNYSYKNKFGRVTWAKIVKNEFKSEHARLDVTELKEKKLIEQEIVDQFVTLSLVEKERAKIEGEDGWSSRHIPRLLGTIYYSLVKEEAWNFVKQFKNPTINFKTLSYLTTVRIKELMPNIF
jgi:hypothetical protein